MKTVSLSTTGALLCAVFLALPSVLSPTASAQQVAAGGYKIGIVDMDRVRDEHTWLKAEYAKLEGLVQQLEAQLKPLQDEIDKLTEQYKAGQAALSNIDKIKLENEIKEKSVAYQNGWKQRQLQIDEQEIEVNKQAFTDIQAVIESLAEQEQYHLVMRAQKDPRSQVLYFSTAIDITSQVVERLNKLKR